LMSYRTRQRVARHVPRVRLRPETSDYINAVCMEDARTERGEDMTSVYTANIGNGRYVSVDDENGVTIADDEKKCRAFFTGPRWAKFVGDMGDIDIAVGCAKTLRPIEFRRHIGGNWYVTVKDEVPVVDIRRWYLRDNKVMQPTPTGIALKFSQWNNLKMAVARIHRDVPQLAAVSPCMHDSQRHMMMCSECTPTPLFDD